jgi:hypothetical protein
MSQIITIDDLTGYMNKTLTSTVAQQVVDAVNAYVERVTHRCWGETKIATERVDWNSSLYLRHQDVVGITTINTGYPGQTPDLMDEADYYVNPLGRVSFFTSTGGLAPATRGSRSRNDWLEITYEYGQLEVPEDLRLAALGLAAGFYNWASNGQREISSTQVGSYRVQFAGSGQPGGGDATADAHRSIIASYAMRRV